MNTARVCDCCNQFRPLTTIHTVTVCKRCVRGEFALVKDLIAVRLGYARRSLAYRAIMRHSADEILVIGGRNNVVLVRGRILWLG